MAAAPLTEAQKAAGLDPDLQFILSETGADLATQAILYDQNFRTIRMLSVVGDTRADARQAFRAWGVDITNGPAMVARMAWLVTIPDSTSTSPSILPEDCCSDKARANGTPESTSLRAEARVTRNANPSKQTCVRKVGRKVHQPMQRQPGG